MEHILLDVSRLLPAGVVFVGVFPPSSVGRSFVHFLKILLSLGLSFLSADRLTDYGRTNGVQTLVPSGVTDRGLKRLI